MMVYNFPHRPTSPLFSQPLIYQESHSNSPKNKEDVIKYKRSSPSSSQSGLTHFQTQGRLLIKPPPPSWLTLLLQMETVFLQMGAGALIDRMFGVYVRHSSMALSASSPWRMSSFRHTAAAAEPTQLREVPSAGNSRGYKHNRYSCEPSTVCVRAQRYAVPPSSAGGRSLPWASLCLMSTAAVFVK